MELLEKQFYSAAFITPASESYAYYLREPRSTVAATDAGRIVGFINLFPVVDEVYRRLLTGTYNDRDLTYQDMQTPDPAGDAPLHMFLSCIAVANAYRRQGAAAALLCAAIDRYADVLHRCDTIVTDNVTAAGCRFSERLGLAFICKSDHGSRIYAGAYGAFVERALQMPG